MALPLYPVYIAKEGFVPPKTGTYYLVTSKGVYIHRQLKFGSGLVKVEGVPWLQEPDLNFKLSLPQIPGRIIGLAWEFFAAVFEKHRSESYLTLLFNEEQKAYKLYCPTQEVSHGSANYGVDLSGDLVEKLTEDGQVVRVNPNAKFDAIAPADREGWVVVGTIHSHCDFSAFHSGTDTHDEEQMDGIHITLGHVNAINCSASIEVAMTGQRYKVDPEACCDGFVTVDETEEQVQSQWMPSIGFVQGNVRSEKRYNLKLDSEQQKLLNQDVALVEEWLPKVTKKTFVASTFKGYGDMFSGGKKGRKTKNRHQDLFFNDNDELNFID